jgi:hypothetical protein
MFAKECWSLVGSELIIPAVKLVTVDYFTNLGVKSQ